MRVNSLLALAAFAAGALTGSCVGDETSPAAGGPYELSLWLPDGADALRDDPRYAIRLANGGVWDESTGLNRLVTIEVDPAAPGSTDPGADALEVLP